MAKAHVRTMVERATGLELGRSSASVKSVTIRLGADSSRPRIEVRRSAKVAAKAG